MRVILFRGKRIDNGEWVFGHIFTQVFHPDTIEEEWYWFIKPIGSKSYEKYRVDPTTVGQYTGMTDMAGVKIFEGDLLSATINAKFNKRKNDWGMEEFDTEKRETVWSVEWKVFNAKHGFFVYGRDRRFNALLSHSIMINCDCRVIGNVHDNPELLKEVS